MSDSSESLEEHLNQIDKRLQKPVSNGQIALSGLSGAFDVVVGSGVAGIVWGTGRRVKQITDEYAALRAAGEIKAGDELVLDEGAFSIKSLAEEGWRGAKEHPKTALAILGVSTAIGLADGAYTYLRFKDKNNQEVGEHVREIRKRSAELSPEKLHEASSRILGRDVCVEKAIGQKAPTQHGASL